jgi:4-methyl-5(b-hydroxyethyl)-thiazole monophosphate biosynthesis
LPGGSGASNFVKDKNLCNMLMQQAEKERIIGAICASPVVVLEPLGLLKGKTVTCYPPMANKLKDCTHSNERVVMSENISKAYLINFV